ncbi:hypothetical protein Plhal703r1_c26g0108751 [Plasmopara halstedii]
MYSLKFLGIVVWFLLSIVEVESKAAVFTKFFMGDSSSPYKKIPKGVVGFEDYILKTYGNQNVQVQRFLSGLTFLEHCKETQFHHRYILNGSPTVEVYKDFDAYHRFVTDLYKKYENAKDAPFQAEILQKITDIHHGFGLSLGQYVKEVTS